METTPKPGDRHIGLSATVHQQRGLRHRSSAAGQRLPVDMGHCIQQLEEEAVAALLNTSMPIQEEDLLLPRQQCQDHRCDDRRHDGNLTYCDARHNFRSRFLEQTQAMLLRHKILWLMR